VAETDRDIDDLFGELVRTEPEPRDPVAEQARRRRISAVIDARLSQQEETSRPSKASASTKWRWVWAAAAAGVVAALGAARFSERANVVTLEREPLARASGGRAQEPDIFVPALPGRARPDADPVDSPSRAAARAPVSSARATATGGSTPTASAAPSASATVEENPAASLRAQNELFQSAVRAARRGDDPTALAEFDALLQRFPGSPLAADAQVRKFRTLYRLGRTTEARAAASDYLARYPQGFARAEAEQILAQAPSPAENPSSP
jgi:TolA-binding protein